MNFIQVCKTKIVKTFGYYGLYSECTHILDTHVKQIYT